MGSVSDNKLGGWYAYRASKAALNMIIKNASIEMARKNKNAIIVGLHPGTVDSELSRPFQRNVETDITPEYSVQKLLGVVENLTLSQTGKCFAWDESEVLQTMSLVFITVKSTCNQGLQALIQVESIIPS